VQLEDQMTNFTSDFDRRAAGYSPDRVDSLVWGCTKLLVEPMKGFGIYEVMRRQAAGETLEQIAGIVARQGEEPKRESLLDLYKRRMAEIAAGKK